MPGSQQASKQTSEPASKQASEQSRFKVLPQAGPHLPCLVLVNCS